MSAGDLHGHLLTRTLLCSDTSHDNLLLHVSCCAQVCSDWWRAVSSSVGYGEEWANQAGWRPERAWALKTISSALERARSTTASQAGRLNLSMCKVGNEGVRTLAVVMQALPAPLAFSSINLVGCGLTAGNALLLAKSMRKGFQQTASLSMKELYVGSNPDLGDEGLTALAGALPNTLESLFLDNTGCGDRAMATIATALPAMPGLQKLELQRNPAVSKVGWAALGNALPKLPELKKLGCERCAMDDAGAVALAAGIQEAPSLIRLDLAGSNFGDLGKRALATVARNRIERRLEILY